MNSLFQPKTDVYLNFRYAGTSTNEIVSAEKKNEIGKYPMQDGDCCLNYVIDGEGVIQIGKKYYNLVKGDALLSYPGQRYDVQCDNRKFYRFYGHFDILSLDKANPVSPQDFFPDPFVKINNPDLFEILCFNIIAEYHKKLYMQFSKLNALITELTAIAIRDSQAGLLHGTLEKKDLFNCIGQIQKHIASNPQKAFSIELLAQNAGYSRSQFYKVFKEIVHMTPFEYIKKCRIEKAQALLVEKKHTVSEIAAICGFCDIYHFSKVFKKYTGVSPTEYSRTFQSDFTMIDHYHAELPGQVKY